MEPDQSTDLEKTKTDHARSHHVQVTVGDLNELLRGEISAAETYKMAIDGVEDPEIERELRAIADEHGTAIAELRRRITELQGVPVDHSGLWGRWAKLVEGLARAMGDSAALKALRQGELYGLDEYRRAVTNQQMPEHVRVELRDHGVARQVEHVQKLERLIEAAGSK